MQKILFPLQSGDKGPEIRNLHEAILNLSRKLNIQNFQGLLNNPEFLGTFEKERREEVYGEATRQVISTFQVLYQQPPTGIIDEATAGTLNGLLEQYNLLPAPPAATNTVYGTVYDQWIDPLPGAPVMLLVRDIRSEHIIGETQTDEKGKYTITYIPGARAKEDKASATPATPAASVDLVVRVYGSDGDPLFTSPVYYNAAARLRADIDMGPYPYQGPSEFTAALDEVKPLIGWLSVEELTETDKIHDLSFLLSKTAIPVNILLQLVASFRYEKWTALPAAVWYGIISQLRLCSSADGKGASLPANLDTTLEQVYASIWTNSVAGMLSAFQQAADNNVIPYKYWADQKKVQTALQRLKNAPPQSTGGTVQLPPIYTTISPAGLTAAQQQAFLENYRPANLGTSFWTTLGQDPSFQGTTGQAAIGKLQAVFQLSDWTAGNNGLVSYILGQYKISAPTDFNTLVSYDISDWTGIITASGAVTTTGSGTDSTATIAGIASTIAAGVERLYPTPVFAARFVKSASLNVANRDYITGVLRSADFDLLSSSVPGYLNTHVSQNPLPQGTDQQTIAYQVMGLQRVYKAVQHSDTALTLLSANIQSARQIYAMGRSNFVNQFQQQLGGADATGAIYDQAATAHAGAAYLTGKMVSTLNNPSANVMPSYGNGVKASTFASDYPNLANLFGVGASYCECTDCESFLGIPAYLTDLLDFLYQRKTTTGSSKPNARAVLLANDYSMSSLKFRRRPDLGDIDLTCDNTNIELPYIDIANELMEDYIIPPITAFRIHLPQKPPAQVFIDFIGWIVAYLSPGTIATDLYKLLLRIGNDPKTPICNISLLSSAAVVSDIFFSDSENYPSWIAETWVPQWIVRDEFITLKLTLAVNVKSIDAITQAFGKDLIVIDLNHETKTAVATPTKLVPLYDASTFERDNDSDRENLYFALIVQEIHQTHLTADVISANPEYTNTNVYNSLSDPFNTYSNNKWDLYPNRIPMSLPFDLYFTEANIFLEKMGKKRYDLMNTYCQQTTYLPAAAPVLAGNTMSIIPIAYAYLDLSPGETEVIFTARPAQQVKFWGPLLVVAQPEVDLFLTASGLTFVQLQTLLTLTFINPTGDSYIADLLNGQVVGRDQAVTIYDTCNTAAMVITSMTKEKLDHINRFLRLWNQLNTLTTITMQELDDCIMSVALGNGVLDDNFAAHVYYFLQGMSQIGVSATQLLVLYQDISATGTDSLYLQLFQNRQISNPLVPAFNLPLPSGASVTKIADAQANPGAVAVILTACGITQNDLTAILTLNNGAYADLTIDNLSFIYACGLLSGALSCSVADLFTFTGLLGFNPLRQILPASSAAIPRYTIDFISKYNEVQNAGFTVDGLNYLLTNQSNATPSLIPDTTTVINGLTGFRSAIQTAVVATTPAPDPKGVLLKKWLADPDLNWNKTIAANLLAILGANTAVGTATATGAATSTAASSATPTVSYTQLVQDNLRFLQLLQTQYGVAPATAYLDRMPSISFPDSTITGLQYDTTNYYLFYYGTISATLSQFLTSLAPDAASKTAVSSLHSQSQGCPLSAVLLPGATLAAPPAWVARAQQNVPAFSGGAGALGFKGAMSLSIYLSLLAQSSDSGYAAALGQLFIASQSAAAATITSVRFSALPSIVLPDRNTTTLAYNGTTKVLSFDGVMSAGDCRALLSLSADSSFQTALCQLFLASQTGQAVSVPLTALPAGWSVLPDISGLAGISFANGALCFSGQINTTVQTALLSLSPDASWTTAVNTLFSMTQSAIAVTTPITELPAGITPAFFPLYTVSYTAPAGTNPAALGYTGVMSTSVLDLLLAASADAVWSAAVTALYQASQASLVTAVQFPLPSGLTAASFTSVATLTVTVTGSTATLSYPGQMPPASQQALLALSTDAVYTTAINDLFGQTSAILPGALPAIRLPLPDSYLPGITYAPGAVIFTGVPNPDSMDEFNLQLLGTDPSYINAIGFIYSATTPATGVVGVEIPALPPISLPASIKISWAGGQLSFTGQMQTSEFQTLQQLSDDSSYQAALASLIVTLAVLPAGVTAASLLTSGVASTAAGTGYALSYSGVMSTATLTGLLALSADPDYQAAIYSLYDESQNIVVQTAPLASLPPITIPTGLGITYDPVNFVLYYQGAAAIPAATLTALNGLSTAADYQASVHLLTGIVPVAGTYQVFAPPPQTPFTAPGLTLASGAIAYQGGTLAFTGPMSFEDYLGVLALSSDPVWQGTVSGLFISSQPVPATTTVTSPGYLGLPAWTFPGLYASQLSYASATSTLTLTGYIGAADQSVLLSMSTGHTWQQAIGTLYTTVSAGENGGSKAFPNLYESLLPLDSGMVIPPSPTDCYAYFLNAISIVYQPMKEQEALGAQLSDTFGFSAAVAAMLVVDLPDLFAKMTDPAFSANTRAVNPDPVQCPQALWYMRLARMAFLINQYAISAADTDWLIKNGASLNALDLTAYPDPLHPLTFSQWETFNGFRVFQHTYKPLTIANPAIPGQNSSVSVYSIVSGILTIIADLAAAPAIAPDPGDLIDQLTLLTGWNKADLFYLLNIDQHAQPGLTLNPLAFTDSGIPSLGCLTDLTDISLLLRLSACFAIATRLKITPARCVVWTTDPLTDTIATDVKQALKSLYPDAASWTSTIVPLMNTLRQNRRDAVLAYLLANNVINPFGKFNVFPDEYGVYSNFLIDPLMAACQQTTRVIQAYCSIQLFVQRCLLNVEEPLIKPDTNPNTGDPDWLQWSWMGTYEGWYEARYTFLFPENLIIPQTLPNQSVFFKNMQNDLTQGPVTADLVNTAFGNYIESADQIAHLQIKGMWFDHPTGVLHVVGSTYGGSPAIWYYRNLNAFGLWSPWEEVTANISGDSVILVMQNGRLYLYWPVFTQTSDDDKSSQNLPPVSSTSGTSSGTPCKYWKIQMAFSEYRNGQWSGKKISSDFLTSGTLLISGGTNSGGASPVTYPDTSDFVFIALDIPQKNSNSYNSTIEALDINNNMIVSCYQSIPKQVYAVVTVVIANSKDKFTSAPLTVNIPIDPAKPVFNVQKVLDLLNDHIGDGSGSSFKNWDLTSSAVISLVPGNPASAIQSIINAAITDGAVAASVAITYTTTPSPDKLSLLPNSPDSFLLDPARGYPTATDLDDYTSYGSPTISPLWFENSRFYDMLAEGTLPLNANDGTPILEATGIGYNNLLSMQMGLWAKYNYFTEGKTDLDKLGALMPFYYQDAARTFYVDKAVISSGSSFNYQEAVAAFRTFNGNSTLISQFTSAFSGLCMDNGPLFQFLNFYHPFVHYFIKIQAQYGIAEVLTRGIQLMGDQDYGANADVQQNLIYQGGYKNFDFGTVYKPSITLSDFDDAGTSIGFPVEQMDFDINSSYGQYNWELFFHGVLMSAMMLSQNQQFEDADAWFKMIFNPTDTSSDPAPQKFWVTKPFYKNNASTLSFDDQILLYEADPASQQQFWESVILWRNDPYDPHMLAQFRITPYMLTTYMKYLDNLIAWANFNYTQYTMESVNIAIQLYMLALETLGTKPEAIPPVAEVPVCNYYQVELNLEILMAIDGTDGYLSDPIVMVENLIPPVPSGSSPGNSSGKNQKLPQLPGLYFCIPSNQVLLGYWDTINTQLNKIRNCMNIEGQFQPLSPFPSIPGLNGIDGSGIGDFGGVLPNYRFNTMVQKAIELCNEVRSLGSSLLSALEKQDAEGLALLRAQQEVAVQNAVDVIKQLQITDAQLSLQNLQDYQALLNDKVTYYSGLLQNDGLIPLEQQALALNQSSLALESPISQGTVLASFLRTIPSFSIGIAGFGGSPNVSMSIGGNELASAEEAFVQKMTFDGQIDDKTASLAVTNASYTRRIADWNFQLTLAKDELTQVGAQIQAAQNKITIATQDEQNQQLLIQNADDVETFLENKYTNQQLYSWMVTQLSNVYFRSYQLAYSIAKQAEICFRYELGITDTSYINYGYWDSLHKGLLSGEGLISSLRQMEMDYLNLNIREYELTRNISLAQLDPAALQQLKSGGSCFINIPEDLFDLDYPGHYFRRVKKVAITLPGVVGPYTPVCLKMTLLNNSVRIVNTAGSPDSYPRNRNSSGAPTNDSRFLDNVAATQFMATSTGVNDDGMYEMKASDDRFTLFERAGAISTWQLELPSVYQQFDPESITDLIIHLDYTSRDGGPDLENAARTSLQKRLSTALSAPGLVLMRGFSARRDFPTQWYKFLNPANLPDPQVLEMDITRRFPYYTRGLTIKISHVVVLADLPAGAGAEGSGQPVLYLSGQRLNNQLINFGPDPLYGPDMLYSTTSCKDSPGVWQISGGTGPGVTPVTGSGINDLIVIFYYSLVNPAD